MLCHLPGQVVLSQQSGVNWLMAVDPNGALGTQLKLSGRLGIPLVSTAVITNGAWHRIGFTWDGASRILYVDDIEVARDAHNSLVGATAGLYIGAGSDLAAGSFWSGLIDDVRMYNRAVTP